LPRVIVVVPTLDAGAVLSECLESLERQTSRDFGIVVVDNSGRGAAGGAAAQVIVNAKNVGFGAAINQAVRQTDSEYIATLNDDAAAEPRWIEALVDAVSSREQCGMGASCVMLAGTDRLDSAGMLLCGDGSSKQKGHGERVSSDGAVEEALLPSGSAALYRRAMLDEIGLFDEEFFLYCEDTDLGLRARWAGWGCVYVPEARVHHRYSHSAGKASALKAYYVERNRLFVVVKNFPVSMLPAVGPIAAMRYFWHAASMGSGRGAAGTFRSEGGNPLQLAWFVLRAQLALVAALPRLLQQRRRIRETARIEAGEFRRLAQRYAIRAREVAAL
jgi:GT2 family glycosyltransferase